VGTCVPGRIQHSSSSVAASSRPLRVSAPPHHPPAPTRPRLANARFAADGRGCPRRRRRLRPLRVSTAMATSTENFTASSVLVLHRFVFSSASVPPSNTQQRAVAAQAVGLRVGLPVGVVGIGLGRAHGFVSLLAPGVERPSRAADEPHEGSQASRVQGEEGSRGPPTLS
jgi:hypothetical protein